MNTTDKKSQNKRDCTDEQTKNIRKRDSNKTLSKIKVKVTLLTSNLKIKRKGILLTSKLKINRNGL